MTERWQFGQHEALWGDPAPTTPEGQRLWRLFKDGKLGTSSSGIRDFGQRVCQIEAEAKASVGQRLAELLDAITEWETPPESRDRDVMVSAATAKLTRVRVVAARARDYLAREASDSPEKPT